MNVLLKKHVSLLKKEMVLMKKMLMSVLILVALCVLAGCGSVPSASQAGTPTSQSTTTTVPSTATAQPTSPAVQPTAPLVPFKVTSVDMSVSPASIAGMSCGAQVTVTYTATFHVTPGSSGGTVQFGYTVNNGRGQRNASLTFAAGQATRTFQFTWSGALPIDHTYPEPGGVNVTSPNQVLSPLVGPTGTCSPAAFKVTSIGMQVSPTSIAGMPCGTQVTVTYTATFHVTPGSTGGVVNFGYTVNNGRGGGDNTNSLTFAPGVTTMTFSFTWSGALPVDHTYPEPGGVLVSSPNVINSPLLGPSGTCS
jgi:predicted small lipoprotein YifL